MTFSIIIATVDRPEFLLTTIGLCLAQQSESFEVVVVDQTPQYTPDVEQKLGAIKDKIVYVRSEIRSASHARNLGIAKARGEFLLFLDDDVVFGPELLSRHLEAHRTAKEAGAITGVIIEKDWGDDVRAAIEGRIASYFPIDTAKTTRLLPITWAPSGNISYQRRAILATGGFDEMLLTYAEDLDLSLAVREAGYGLFLCRDAELIHLAAKRGGCDQRNPLLKAEKAADRTSSMYYVILKHARILGLWFVVREVWRIFRFEAFNLTLLNRGIPCLCRALRHNLGLLFCAARRAKNARTAVSNSALMTSSNA